MKILLDGRGAESSIQDISEPGGELAYHYKEGSEVAAGYAFLTILDYFEQCR